MCIAIFPLAENSHIELSFVLERIYQRRDGGTVISMDMLVKNVSETSIDRLRIVVPYSMFDLSGIERTRKERQITRKIAKLKRRQLEALQLCTEELTVSGHKSHWIYRALSHVTMDTSEIKSGVFKLSRDFDDRSHHSDVLAGYIKQGWSVEMPNEAGFSDWTWLLYSLNNVSLFDVAQAGRDQEKLHSGESMWLRLMIKVPALEHNKKSWFERVFARAVDYRQVFWSPSIVCRNTRRVLEQFEVDEIGSTVIGPSLGAAKQTALEYLPRDDADVVVRDWRTFLYREYGLEVAALEPSSEQRGLRQKTDQFLLPTAADPPGCRRGPLPRWLQWVYFGSRRSSVAVELFFGADYEGCSHPDDYELGVITRSGNVIYLYLAWLAFVISLIALIRTFM